MPKHRARLLSRSRTEAHVHETWKRPWRALICGRGAILAAGRGKFECHPLITVLLFCTTLKFYEISYVPQSVSGCLLRARSLFRWDLRSKVKLGTALLCQEIARA